MRLLAEVFHSSAQIFCRCCGMHEDMQLCLPLRQDAFDLAEANGGAAGERA